MKQTVEIEVPDGKKAIWKDNKIIFEDIISSKTSFKQLPKTWEEFCKNYPINSGEFIIGISSQIASPRWGNREIDIDQNVLPNYKAAEQHLALMQLHQLRDCYRQGWKPNWEDDSFKYTIVRDTFDKDKKYSIKHYCYTPYFLSFPIYELANEFLTNFRDLIEQAGDLI